MSNVNFTTGTQTAAPFSWSVTPSLNEQDYRADAVAEEREVIHREYQAELEPTGDGRTLELRIVPFNQRARVRDGLGPEYEEEWLPGCFDRQLSAANRVLVNFEHERGLTNVVGRGVELRSDEAALDGTFRILQGPDGDKALELVNEKVLTGVSLEAVPLRSERGEDGVVRRVKARLLNIALCRTPAFKDAKVLAVREGDEPEEPEPEPDGGGEPEPEVAPDLKLALQRVSQGRVEDALARVGYEALVKRAVTRQPWDGSPSRFTDEEYQRSCLIDRGGDAPPKERCSLPVLEPNGDLNVNGMHAAAGRLNQVTGVPPAVRAAAARKLVRYYRQAGEDPPQNLVNLAGR